MADAELGVIVNVKGAKEGAADLDKFSLSAKGAATSTTELSSARAKADAQWANLIGLKAATSETTKLAQATTATGQSMGLFQRLVSGFGGFFGSFSRDTEGASTSMNHLAGAHGEVAKSIHVLHPLIGSMGGQLGGLSQFAIAARGGLTGLAIAVAGSVVVSLEKAADSLRLLTNRLQALQGDTAGKKTFDLISESASRTGASILSTGDNVKTLSEKLGALPQAWTGLAGTKAVGIIDVLGEAFAKTGTDADTAQASIKKYIDEIGNLDPVTKNVSGLTQKMFDQIRKDSPEVAKLIAEGFGKLFPADAARSLQRFSDQLATAPKSADQLYFALQRVKPEIDKIKFDPTVTQSFVALKNAFIDLWGAIGQSTQLTATVTALTSLTKMIQSLAKDPQVAVEVLKSMAVVIARIAAPATTAITAIGLFSREIAQLGGGSKEATDNLDFILRTLTTIAAFTVNPFVGIIAGLTLFGTKIDDTIQRVNNLINAFNRIPEWARAVLTGAVLGGATGFALGGPQGAATGAVLGAGAGLVSTATGVGGMGATVPNVPSQQSQKPQFGVGTTTQFGKSGSITMIEVPEEAKKATDSVDELNTSLDKVPKRIETINKTEIKVNDTGWNTFTTDVGGDVGKIGNDIESVVAAVTRSIMNMVSNADQALQNLRTSSVGITGGNYASTQPGVSFDATMNDPTLQGYATGGTFKVGGSGANTPVNFMGTPGEIVSVTPVGGNAGSVFQVGGLGGVDSTLVQFSATPGSTVTITPVGLTPPQSQGLGPVVGLTTHVPGMPTLALGGAVIGQSPSSAAATQAAITSAIPAVPTPTAPTDTMLPVGGTGSVNIKPWKGNPAGTQSDYLSASDIYGPDPYSSSPTPDPTPYNYVPIQDIGGGGAINAGSYQTGGSFHIRGGGPPDSKMIAMRLSPDENVVISRPNAGRADRAMNVTLNINGNISPLAFVAAEAQIKRAARRIFQ